MIARRAAMLLAASTLLATGAEAQEAVATAKELALQFAVPTSPAFKLVEVEASAILRPTSFHQFASTLGDLGTSDGGFTVPKELGIEIAPYFLAAGRDLTREQYAAHAGRYRFRVSGAFRRGTGEGKPAMFSAGVRFAPRDASDPRTAPAFVSQLTAITSEIASVCATMARTRPRPNDEPGVVATCADPRGREAGLQKAIAAAPDSIRPGLERELAEFRRVKAVAQETIDAANAKLKKLKTAWTDSAWNKSGLEYAFAGAAQSADTLGRRPEFRRAAAWLSAARQMGSWGQLVGGANFSSGRDSIATAIRQTFAIGLALFVGGDRYKGFVEAQGSGKSAATSAGALANLGGEVYLGPGLWAVASGGWSLDPDTHRGRLVSRFSLRTKFPMKTPDRESADDPDSSR